MIKIGKLFIPPVRSDNDFKTIFKFLVSSGAGRPVDRDGFPDSLWTPELLTTAILEIDPRGQGVDLRTVQLWFQDNNTNGISASNLRLLARIFGCGDPEATSLWQAELTAAKSRLKEKRREVRMSKNGTEHLFSTIESKKDTAESETLIDGVSPSIEPAAVVALIGLASITERLFTGHNAHNLPIIVFSGATTLALLSFSFKVNSILYESKMGIEKQIGFLWAPNWTISFLVILPIYLALLIYVMKAWKNSWRQQVAGISTPLSQGSWNARVSSASYSFWSIFILTFILASGFNWIITHLIPLLEGDAGEWAIDWGRIAIIYPDIISIEKAILFTFLVFIYNGITAYLFFTGLLFIYLITYDYTEIAREFTSIIHESERRRVEKNLMIGFFRCISLGLMIAILMKLQASFLASQSVTIIDWLIEDLRDLITFSERSTPSMVKLISPGHFYSFFSMLAITGVYVNASLRIARRPEYPRPATGKLLAFSSRSTMDLSVFLLVVSFFFIDMVTGFSIVLLVALALSVCTMTGMTLGRAGVRHIKDPDFAE